MKVVVKNDEYTIYQRRDGRYAVEGADKKPINGDEKVAVLAANELIAVTLPAAPEEEAAPEEAASKEAEADAAETETEAAEAGDPEPAAEEASEEPSEEPADASDDDAKAADEE
ncbi:MAG: hypothetical protein ISP99_05730 [Pseudomonadales bacterium]|nr:hypothetical protein [Pseudomonadales bacterium]